MQQQLQVELAWTFLPAERYRSESAANDEVELTEEDLDVSFYDGESIDLKDVLREAVLLEIDAYPSCPTECAEVPVTESANGQSAEDAIDPRWAPLMALKRKSRS